MATSAAGDVAELAITSLPLETRFPPFRLRRYGGFWLVEKFLKDVPAVHSVFKTRPSYVLLGSFPKCGTTWLKALVFATRNRADHSPHDLHHPRRQQAARVLAALPSPRLLATHLPYSLLPRRITAEESGCWIVYICRTQRTHSFPRDGAAAAHIRGGIRAVLRRQMCQRPAVAPRAGLLGGEHEAAGEGALPPKLAEFMRCAFSREEEADGVVHAIVELCSLESLKNMAGVVGDWSNHITPVMAKQPDKIIEEALQGSGFSFAVAESSS
ncbi:hypothetical protein VPH35_135438 [Triticum aestivum]